MKKFKLSNLAFRLLLNLVAGPGWARDLADLYAGGKLLSELKEPTDQTSQVDFELSDKQFECVKKALKHHTSEGHVPPSTAIVELIDSLGIQV